MNKILDVSCINKNFGDLISSAQESLQGDFNSSEFFVNLFSSIRNFYNDSDDNIKNSIIGVKRRLQEKGNKSESLSKYLSQDLDFFVSKQTEETKEGFTYCINMFLNLAQVK